MTRVPLGDRHMALSLLLHLALQRATLSTMLTVITLLLQLWDCGRNQVSVCAFLYLMLTKLGKKNCISLVFFSLNSHVLPVYYYCSYFILIFLIFFPLNQHVIAAYSHYCYLIVIFLIFNIYKTWEKNVHNLHSFH